MGSVERRAERAEFALRRLLDAGMPPPDEVQHEDGDDEMVLLWHESKLAVIVELEERDGAA